MVSWNRDDDADADPLPPRPSGPKGLSRPTTPRHRDTPSTDALLVKKYVDLVEYKADVRAGKFDNLSAEEARARFGSTTLPIFVPLARGESIRQYEKRFEDWLWLEHAMTLSELQGEKLRPLERRLRSTFTELNVNGVERFKLEESSRADGITRLVLSRPSTEQLAAQGASSRPKKDEIDDPVEQQLADAYDLVNKCIGRNEKTFDVSSARLTSGTTSVADIAELAQLHDEKDELAVTIERDTEKRVATLAALAVYLWRHERGDLERMVNDKAASNVPHVQTAGHRKCATLATAIFEKREYATKIRRQLDAAMQRDDDAAGSSESKRLVVLQKLGEMLAKAERELRELLAQRRRALATVIHFDERSRRAIQAQIQTST